MNQPPWELSAARYYWRHVASSEFRAQIEQRFRQGETIQALWLCRESYASNLEQAKEALREWREELGLQDTTILASQPVPNDTIAVIWRTDVRHDGWFWRYISGRISIESDLYINDVNVIGADYAISIEELHSSTNRDGHFAIFTCNCGDAGCAGLDTVEVVHFEDKVLWKDASYLGRTCVFEGCSYREQIGRAYQDATDAFEKLRQQYPNYSTSG